MKKLLVSLASLFLILGVVFGSLASANSRQNQAVTLETPIITNGPGEFTNNKTPTFVFSGPSDSGFYCSIVEIGELEGDFVECTSPYTVNSPLQDGEYEFQVYASANRGEDISEIAYWDFTVATQIPAQPVLRTTPAKYTKAKTALFSFRAADYSLSSFCQLDNQPVQSCRRSVFYRNRNLLTDGWHVFRVYSQDQAGNRSKTTSYYWLIDTKRPVVKFTKKPKQSNKAKRVTFSWRVSELINPEKTICKLGRKTTDCSNRSSISFRPKKGGNTFLVSVRDRAGNSGFIFYRFKQLR